MTPTEIVQAIDRLRRDQPRNPVALALCTACEELLAKTEKTPAANSRAAYMRDYRSKERKLIRAARKAEKAK